MTVDIAADGMLHLPTRADRFWSTANVGEALPGVATPLGWSVWGPAIELGIRDTFVRLGALERSRAGAPNDPSERVVSIFYGRGALSVSFLCEMGDRLPGTSGDAIAGQLLGSVPPELPMKRTLKRMPVVAAQMPVAVALIGKQVLEGTAHIHAWWSDWIERIDTLDADGARIALDDGRRMLLRMTSIQARGVFVGVQSVYDQLVALIERAELEPEAANALMAGQGSHAETEIIADLWALGREQLTLETFLARHGYHGPGEGQLINRMWREHPEPVLRLAAKYAERPDSEDPLGVADERMRERIAAEQQLLAKLPALQRPAGRLILKMAVARVPLRGVAKEALIRALDVTRAAARRLGDHLVEQGALDQRDDAFFFTADELLSGMGKDAKRTAAERRALWELLRNHDIPKHWRGLPEAYAITTPEPNEDVLLSRGIGASGGVTEGIARLVEDPAEAEIEPGDILVCPTTDPSWASIMFLSAGLVVDIGGPLSHAAVVAREIGVPCVIGTGDGTAVVREGDRIKLDGDAGTVEILERATATAAGVR